MPPHAGGSARKAADLVEAASTQSASEIEAHLKGAQLFCYSTL